MSDKPLTDIAFSEFDLHPQLLAGLEAAGFNRCTPIQALTLPLALAGRDVAGQAQTGTGKTLAFLIAVLNRLLTRPALADRKPEDPRALILAPTRELAIQIHKDAVKFGSDLGLKFALVYGGVDYDKQRQILQAGADVIIATPGRLIDYVKQHKVTSLHADPGAHAAARTRGPRRRRPGADGHGQDARVPDRRDQSPARPPRAC